MERLTERREDGTATGIKRSIGDFVGIPEMLMRLAEYEDTGMTPQDIAPLESQLQQAQAELNETYIDEDGETWFRPTAEAYYAACKARNKWQEQSEEWRLDRDFFLVRLEDEKTKVEKLEAENAALRADNAALWEVTAESFQAFSIALEEARGEDWPEIRRLRDKCQQALSILHPGDSLLKELEALRAVREAAQAIISHIDTECDGECQDVAYMKLELALRNALAAVTGGKE